MTYDQTATTLQEARDRAFVRWKAAGFKNGTARTAYYAAVAESESFAAFMSADPFEAGFGGSNDTLQD